MKKLKIEPLTNELKILENPEYRNLVANITEEKLIKTLILIKLKCRGIAEDSIIYDGNRLFYRILNKLLTYQFQTILKKDNVYPLNLTIGEERRILRILREDHSDVYYDVLIGSVKILNDFIEKELKEIC